MRIIVVGIVAAIVVGGGSVKADFTFGTPEKLGPTVNSGGWKFSPCISADGLELYFDFFYKKNEVPDWNTYWDIFVCTRATTHDEWGEPNNLGKLVNSADWDGSPSLSADGLSLFFHSDRPGGSAGFDLWMTRRETKSDPWGPAENLGPPINSDKEESAPCISADGLELYFAFEDPLADDTAFYVSRRETTDAPWGEPISLGPVINSWPKQWEPEISSDGLLLLWSDKYWILHGQQHGDPRPGGLGSTDIWFSRRATKDGQWSEPVNLGPAINTTYGETGPSLSADGSALYFGSNRYIGLGGAAFWQAPIIPIVDLNGDGIVDSADMVIMVDHWGTDNSLCDIGPMPWGDGIVDVEDLKVLAEHLFEEFPPVQ